MPPPPGGFPCPGDSNLNESASCGPLSKLQTPHSSGSESFFTELTFYLAASSFTWRASRQVLFLPGQHSLGSCPVIVTSVLFSSVAQSCPILCDPMNRSTPGLPVHHQLPKFTQTHVHWVGDAIQPSHSLSSPSLPALNLPQHQGLFQWVSSSHQVAKVLEFQLQHQSFQWTPRTDLL